MNVATQALLLTALAGMGSLAQGAGVSIQLVNPDQHANIRIFLDRKLIYEGEPERAGIPVLAGTLELHGSGRHVLIAEVASGPAKAQLEWVPHADSWVVIRYYPGRAEPGEPAFFTFSLQGSAYKLK